MKPWMYYLIATLLLVLSILVRHVKILPGPISIEGSPKIWGCPDCEAVVCVTGKGGTWQDVVSYREHHIQTQHPKIKNLVLWDRVLTPKEIRDIFDSFEDMDDPNQ